MRWIAVFGLLAVGCAVNPGSTEQTTQAMTARLSYEDLVGLIQTQHLTSIEQLLPQLPAELRSSYVLMHDSRSLQGASYDAPRVILFGVDARLTCAFAGAPELPGFDSLECFQFREAERAFDFRQIRFPTRANGLTDVAFSASNQTTDGRTQCTSCHGADPRPNWDGYSTWPGAYGSEDDTLKGDTARYAAFVGKRATDPRYRWLVQGTNPNDPYMGDGITIDHRPNIRFSDASGRMNALRATRLLGHRLPRAKALAFAVAALDCRLTDDQKGRLGGAGIDPARELDVRAIFPEIGVSTADWGTQIFDDASETNDKPWEHQSGFTFLSIDVAMTIAQDEAHAGNAALQTGLDRVAAYVSTHDTGPELAFYSALNELVPDPDFFGGYYEDNTAAVCPALSDAYVDAALRASSSDH